MFATQKRVYIIMEYAECGTVLKVLNDNFSARRKASRESETEGDARSLFVEIMKGIQYVHSRDIAHRFVAVSPLVGVRSSLRVFSR